MNFGHTIQGGFIITGLVFQQIIAWGFHQPILGFITSVAFITIGTIISINITKHINDKGCYNEGR